MKRRFGLVGAVLIGLLGPIGLVNAAGLELMALNSAVDIQKASSSKALVVFLSLDCDLGSYASDEFTQTFYDLKGVNAGIYNINDFPYQIANGHRYDLGGMVIVKNNQVVASTGDYKGNKLDLWGGNGERRWLAENLKQLGVAFTMAIPGPQRAKPADDKNQSNDIAKGLVGYFTFDNAADSSGSKSSTYGGKSGTIANGVFTDTGAYTGEEPLTFTNASHARPLFKDGFGFSFNVKLTSTNEEQNPSGVFFSGAYRTFGVGRRADGTLFMLIEPSAYTDTAQKTLSTWTHAIPLSEAAFPLNQWNHVVFSGDYQSKRVRISVNGKRVDDALLSDEVLRLLKIESPFGPSTLGAFGDMGRGAILAGQVDDLRFYDRLLSGTELAAIALKDRKGQSITGDLPPLDPPTKPTTVSSAGQWAGTWDTFWGSGGRSITPMTLTVSGGKLTGAYQHKDGTVQGTVVVKNGQTVLEGTWKQSDGSGWFRFVLVKDGTAFQGQWGYTGKEAAKEGWNGYRQALTQGRGLKRNS